MGSLSSTTKAAMTTTEATTDASMYLSMALTPPEVIVHPKTNLRDPRHTGTREIES
ncbi:hypothetical protein GCM10027589_30520 [Actinocorallia lasiicapitis]